MKIVESHIVPAISEPIRLQEYAISIFTSIQSRSGLKKAIKKELVLLDGKKAGTGDWIREGQKIELLKPECSPKKAFNLDIEILFEDEHLAIVNKPAGFPTSGNFFKTIENALPYNLKPSSQPDSLQYPLPAHRLDSPTAGLLLCAKTTGTLLKLQKAFAEKSIQKSYYALVQGSLLLQQEITSDIEGKLAHTKIVPLHYYKINSKSYTLVEAKPLTGKTHQIRIHLAKIGHSIVGDSIYGQKETGYFGNKNLYLFSGSISFEHPVTKEGLVASIQLPKRFRNLKTYRVP